jgi:hypothetical protein
MDSGRFWLFIEASPKRVLSSGTWNIDDGFKWKKKTRAGIGKRTRESFLSLRGKVH